MIRMLKRLGLAVLAASGMVLGVATAAYADPTAARAMTVEPMPGGQDDQRDDLIDAIAKDQSDQLFLEVEARNGGPIVPAGND